MQTVLRWFKCPLSLLGFANLNYNDVKMPNFTFSGVWWTQDNDIIFLFSWTFYIALRIQLQKNRHQFTNWTRWNKRDQVWSSANSLCILSDVFVAVGVRGCCLNSPMYVDCGLLADNKNVGILFENLKSSWSSSLRNKNTLQRSQSSAPASLLQLLREVEYEELCRSRRVVYL